MDLYWGYLWSFVSILLFAIAVIVCRYDSDDWDD